MSVLTGAFGLSAMYQFQWYLLHIFRLLQIFHHIHWSKYDIIAGWMVFGCFFYDYMVCCSLINHYRPVGICCLTYFLQNLWELSWPSHHLSNDVNLIFITDRSSPLCCCYYYVPNDVLEGNDTDGNGHLFNLFYFFAQLLYNFAYNLYISHILQ